MSHGDWSFLSLFVEKLSSAGAFYELLNPVVGRVKDRLPSNTVCLYLSCLDIWCNLFVSVYLFIHLFFIVMVVGVFSFSHISKVFLAFVILKGTKQGNSFCNMKYLLK